MEKEIRVTGDPFNANKTLFVVCGFPIKSFVSLNVVMEQFMHVFTMTKRLEWDGYGLYDRFYSVYRVVDKCVLSIRYEFRFAKADTQHKLVDLCKVDYNDLIDHLENMLMLLE